jgi:hypothetical protein
MRATVLAVSLLAFALSANIAWLNPAPESEVFRTGELPVLWQYNADAGLELVTAAWFPSAFDVYPQRINRPTYPAAVHAMSRVVEAIAAPVRPLTRLESAGLSYAALKLFVIVLAGQATLAVLRRRISLGAATMMASVLLLHEHTLVSAAAFHTLELQMFGTVFVAWLACIVVDRESRRRGRGGHGPSSRLYIETFAAAFGVGILLLAKTTLVPVVAFIALAALRKRIALLATVATGIAIPHLIYLSFLRRIGVRYRNWEVEEYGQGVWLLDAIRGGPSVLLPELIAAGGDFAIAAVQFYGPLLLLAGLGLLWSRSLVSPIDRSLMALSGLAAFGQFLAVQRPAGYMTADLALFVAGLLRPLLAKRSSPTEISDGSSEGDHIKG